MRVCIDKSLNYLGDWSESYLARFRARYDRKSRDYPRLNDPQSSFAIPRSNFGEMLLFLHPSCPQHPPGADPYTVRHSIFHYGFETGI